MEVHVRKYQGFCASQYEYIWFYAKSTGSTPIAESNGIWIEIQRKTNEESRNVGIFVISRENNAQKRESSFTKYLPSCQNLGKSRKLNVQPDEHGDIWN